MLTAFSMTFARYESKEIGLKFLSLVGSAED